VDDHSSLFYSLLGSIPRRLRRHSGESRNPESGCPPQGDMTNTSLLAARIIYFIFNFFCTLATLHETSFPDFSEVSIHVFHPYRVSWLSFNGFQFHICAGIAAMLPT
jgi:hypothetical protein